MTYYNIKFNNTHPLTSQHVRARARTHTHTHMHMHACKKTHVQQHLCINTAKATVNGGFQLSFKLGFWHIIAYRVWEFIPCDRAQIGKARCPLEPFLSFWYPKSAGISSRTQWMGWDIQVKQVRQVRWGQFLRLHHSTWKRLYIQFFELLEASAAESRVVKHECI